MFGYPTTTDVSAFARLLKSIDQGWKIFIE